MMLGSLGKLYTLGYPVDWHRLYPQPRRFVRLPGDTRTDEQVIEFLKSRTRRIAALLATRLSTITQA